MRLIDTMTPEEIEVLYLKGMLRERRLSQRPPPSRTEAGKCPVQSVPSEPEKGLDNKAASDNNKTCNE